jgi:hypothetical protein
VLLPSQPTSANESTRRITITRPSTTRFRRYMCSSPFRIDMSRRVINPPAHRLLQGATVLLDRGRIPSVPMSVSNNVNTIAFARLTSSLLKRPRLRGTYLANHCHLPFPLIFRIVQQIRGIINDGLHCAREQSAITPFHLVVFI